MPHHFPERWTISIQAALRAPSPRWASWRSVSFTFAGLAGFAALFFGLALSRSAAQSPAGEYQVKAAFIFHFAQMVEWPADSLGGDGSPLVVCIIEGDDSYFQVMDSVVQGKQIGTHPIKTRRLRDPAAIPGCHLLVIAASDDRRATAILSGIKDAPLLTIGESHDFTAAGGIIGLALQDNKIRFDINLGAAQRVNLKISARLLLLARNVIGGKQG